MQWCVNNISKLNYEYAMQKFHVPIISHLKEYKHIAKIKI